MPVKIAPSILTADFGRIADACREAEAGGADYPVTTSTDGRWVASTRWMPAARASWVMRTIASSTSRGATIIRSASSSTITSRYGYGWQLALAALGRLDLAVPHGLR